MGYDGVSDGELTNYIILYVSGSHDSNVSTRRNCMIKRILKGIWNLTWKSTLTGIAIAVLIWCVKYIPQEGIKGITTGAILG